MHMVALVNVEGVMQKLLAVGTAHQVQTLTFEQSIESSQKKLALQNLGLDSADTQGPQEEDDDDLLDLLDSVAQS